MIVKDKRPRGRFRVFFNEEKAKAAFAILHQDELEQIKRGELLDIEHIFLERKKND